MPGRRFSDGAGWKVDVMRAPLSLQWLEPADRLAPAPAARRNRPKLICNDDDDIPVLRLGHPVSGFDHGAVLTISFEQ